MSETVNGKYTGTIMINAIFELKIDNTFHVTFNARTSTPLSINLINNLYFNLGGHVRIIILKFEYAFSNC